MLRIVAVGTVLAALTIAATATFTQAQDAKKYTLGLPIAAGSTFVVADGLEAFKKEGLNVKTEYFAEVSMTRKALLTGQVQFASIGLGPLLQADALGADLKMIAVTEYSFTDKAGKSWESTALVAPPAKNIKSLQDLKGKKLGIDSFGSTYYVAFTDKLRKEGIDPKTITMVTVPWTQLGGALVTGQIDAAIMFVTDIERTRERMPLDRVMTEFEYTGVRTSVTTGIVAKASWLKNNRDAALGVLRAYLKTREFMRKDRVENDGKFTREQLNAYMKAGPEVADLYYKIRGGYAGLELDYVNYLEVPRDSVEAYNKLLVEGNSLQGKPPVSFEQAVDTELLKEAYKQVELTWIDHGN